MIRHASHAQNHFTLLETWYLIQPNIPTRTAMFSRPIRPVNNSYCSGEKSFLFEPMKWSLSFLPTQSLGRTAPILVVVQTSAMSSSILGMIEAHSAAAAWSCSSPADPWPLLPRTKALSLESSVEVPALPVTRCILSSDYNGKKQGYHPPINSFSNAITCFPQMTMPGSWVV